jgi:hypothetical protein
MKMCPTGKILSCINQAEVRNFGSYLNKVNNKWFSEVNGRK